MTGMEFLEALPAAVYATDAAGRITFYNQAAADLWGCRPHLGSDRWCGSWRLYWPDGRPLPHDECPMAVTLKEGRPVRGVEAIAERPDGTRVRFLPFPTPLRDASGTITGAVNLLVDLTDRDGADLMSARLAAIVTSSDDAIISKTLRGEITSWNAAATNIFGYEEHEMLGQSIMRLIPPELREEEKKILARLQDGGRIDHYETVRVGKDGRRVNVSLTVSPIRDRFGTVVGASKVARDISERKQAEELQGLLVEELNHRVKNTLAMIQAVAGQSLRHAKSPSDFVAGFNGRVQALARAHDLLVRSKLRGAELMDLVHEQVLLGGAEDNRITCSGPAVMLDAQAAVHIALVLHELATNARKYGALSVPSGRLSVEWEIRAEEETSLIVKWKERAGPKITAPAERGFGSSLIERTLKAYGGQISTCYDKDGLSTLITLPLPKQGRRHGERSAPRLYAEGTVFVREPGGSRILKGNRIIIIEDEPLVCLDLESILATADCEIAGTAGTLSEAKALCADAVCDAALVDANLAGQPVDELLITLTKRDIPFAFVTGYRRQSLPEGFRDAIVLKKPFSRNEVIGIVETLIYRAPGVVRLRRRET